MWFISPFVPIFFRPTDDRYGVKSKYIQKFAPTDNILLEVICDNLDFPPVLKLNNVRTGFSTEITWKSWIMNESRVLYYYTFSDLECDIYNVEIGGFKSEPFEIITDEKELGKSTLIKYTMRNNRMRLDGVFWIDGIQHTFEFRVPGGFKDDDRIFSVDNEQFVTPYGNIVEMYGMDSVQRVFTLGNEIGCPIWFAELLNRILCCTHVYFEGVQYARKDSSIPEKTQLIAGMKSYVFKQNLQEVKDDLSVTFGEEGGGSTGGGSEGGGAGAGIDILRLIDDDRKPTDNNVFSSARSIYEIKFYCEYYGKEYEKKFLRKDKADGTPFPFTFGDYVKFGEFLTGISGGYIDKNGGMEMDSGVFRKRLFVPEIAYNRTTYFKGRMVNSPGGGCTVKEWTDNGDGSYTVIPELTDADGLSQFVDDILTTYFTARDANGRLQAFEEMKFRVTAVDYDAKTFVMTPKPGTAWKPGESMVLAQTGNFTDAERQTYILIDSVNGNNCITFYDNANTWDAEPAQEKSWFGKKKGRTVHGIPADNYSAVLRNIIMSGKIFQVDDITGEAFRVPLCKGAWKSGTMYAYYDEVTHDGSSWMCVNPAGTTSEPSDSNSDWLKYVSKGTDGIDGVDGTSITNCGTWHTGLHVPYMGLVKMAERVFICTNPAGTDNPPMWTITDKDGNRLRQTQDGGQTYGYIITGKFNTAEYELLVENGKDGRDGTDHEWIFKHTTDNVAPATPATSQVDDYVPDGWHDDAMGVSESLPYEWACSRTKKDGVWSAFTPAALWAKFGFDGESFILADIDNEMDSVALTYEGLTTEATVLNTTVGMWYGTEKLPLKAIACAVPAGVTANYNVNTGVVTLTVAGGVSMPERSQVKITVTAAWQGADYNRDLVFTIAGVRAGSPGADAVLYRLVPSVSSVSKRKDGTYSVANVSCTRTKYAGGNTAITTDGVLKYSKDGGTEVEIQNGTTISSKDFTSSLQFVYYVNGQVVDRETVPMVVDGADGEPGTQGVPGIPGKDGKILYTWIRYADDANGGGISNNPTGKKYLGMAYNKESTVESNNPKDYQWSNIKGEDGIGVPGADGKTYYTWVAYSDNADGRGMYQQPNDNTRYIGIAVNKETSVESNNPADYTWSKFRGEDGKDGVDGVDGTSITNCGDWHTGLHVPYMGLVKMAERVFLCMNPAGTSNPPMWTITDKDGNRLLQTQDGGRTYGYIITGELNTAEYELLVENGKDGRDGTDYEWIFKHTTDNVAPATPATSQVDDHVPSGWHDDAIGVSESLPYEWACSRTKKDGVWSAFTPAALWAKFGFDGESVILADIDNEMDSVALTYEGRTTASTVLNATVGMWYGTEKLPLKSIACATPAGVTASHNVNTGVVAMTVAGGVSMPERSQVRITVTATWQGVDYSRDLMFTIAGVRAGSPGADAVLYRLVPSVSSVSKRKDGTYSVASVSCTRTKSVDGNTAITTDGVLKYSKDGGAEVEIQNGTAISPRNFTSSLQFVYYVNGQVVDRETVPMVVDGNDGHPGSDGNDGTSIKAGGEWRTANTPVAALTICTMGGRAWLSKVTTSNPPMWTITDKDGNRLLQTQDGGRTYGYILTGELNTAEWELVASDGMMVYLTSTVSNIRVSNAGSLVPSAFKVYAKRTIGSAVMSYADGYLVARGYSNGIWSVVAGPLRSSELTVNASAGYSTFSVRCYQTQADAAAWNDNFIAEQSVGVSYDGGRGATGAEPRPRGLFASGNTYVWNDRFHDIVLATFNDRTIPFRVRAYGASVTAAPSSIDGDANWEPAQQFQFVATDLLLSRQIRADEIYADGLKVTNGLFDGSIATPPVILEGDGNVSLNLSTGFNFAGFANSGVREFVLPSDKIYNGVHSLITHLGGYDINIVLENGTIRCGSSVVTRLVLPGYGMAYMYAVLPNPSNNFVIWYVVNNASFTAEYGEAKFNR